MKIYARVRENQHFTLFHSPNISHAVSGFRELGAEVIKYNTIDEIYDKVTKEDIVLDYIGQCLTIFDKFGVHPELEDYPEALKPFLGRNIWEDTIDNINTNTDKWGIFVKPIKQKAFTGRVINSTKDLIGCGSCYENYKVLCSDVVNVKREWRGFIYYDELIDIRPYKGDWHYNYNPDTIDKILEAFRNWEERPVACSLDFAVIEKDTEIMRQTEIGLIHTGEFLKQRQTIFLEQNDSYALGNYGLNAIAYAKMISARWSQLLNREDEFHF